VRWDVDLASGATQRVLTSKVAGAGDPGLGASVDLSGHIALLPLVRLGLYAHHDAYALAGLGVRDLDAAGLDATLAFPWLRRDVRAYARLGLGEAAVHSPSGDGPAAGWGSFTEVPVGVGLRFRLGRRLWLTTELTARVGFAFGGGAYGRGSWGDDALAVGLDVGFVWGR